MTFQVVELNMNLMLNQVNGNFTKIFNQLETLSNNLGVWLSDKDSFTLNQLSEVRSLALGMEKH